VGLVIRVACICMYIYFNNNNNNIYVYMYICAFIIAAATSGPPPPYARHILLYVYEKITARARAQKKNDQSRNNAGERE